jgi:hypothetical protein
VLSITLTVCVAVAVLPAPSVTVHVTVVVPNGKIAGASLVTDATVQLSAVAGVPKFAITASHDAFAFTVSASGATIVGFVLSFTVTSCVTVVTLPLLSVTVHVTVVFPSWNTLGASLVTLVIVQLSVAVGVPNATLNATHELFAATTTAAGAVTTGACVSLTVTVCVAVDTFPLLSVTVQFTVVVPNGKIAGALLVTVATPQLSAVVGVPNTTVVAAQFASAEATMFAGATIVGFVLSITLTVCVAVAVLPAPSVTVHVTVVVPNGKVAGALLLTDATEQLSAVAGVPKFAITASHDAFAFTVSASGATIVGLMSSTTTISCVAVAVFPLLSVTVHVTIVVPVAKISGALFVTLAMPQLSAVTGVPRLTLNIIQLFTALKERSAGAVIVGF